MPYRILDSIATADIAFEAWAEVIEELFCHCADALLSVMVNNIDAIEEYECQKFEQESDALDMLLYKVLEELIFLKDSKQMLYRVRNVTIEQRESSVHFSGTLCGEKINSIKHQLLVDVKAVTFHNFYVRKEDPFWKAQITLDI